MRYRQVGRTSIQVSEVGFGCWTMGGPAFSPANGAPIGWADVDEAQVLAGIKAGLDAGVNHWDNADVYGNGRAERMLAAGFRALGVKPGSQVIATKVGHMKGTAPHAFEPRHMRAQCEQSLRNLGVETIDIYYCHHGSYVGPGYDQAQHDYLHEAAGVMHALKKEGKIRAIGQSAYGDDDFARAIPVLKPDVLQSKANMRFDPFIDQHGCTFVAFGPLDQGILLDKFDPEKPPKFDEGDYRASRQDFAPDVLRGVRAKISSIKKRFGIENLRGEELTAALSSIASRWVLAHPHVCSAIPGFRNAMQARCNVGAGSDAPMSDADVAFIRGLFGGEK
jgi:myo-inositol catabolism protein IolS